MGMTEVETGFWKGHCEFGFGYVKIEKPIRHLGLLNIEVWKVKDKVGLDVYIWESTSYR